MPAPVDSCMFCGEQHRGACGGGKPKPKKERPLKVATPPAPSAEQVTRPSKLDRMRAAASENWTPTVEQVPRRRAQPASITEAAIKTERNYTTAIDPDTVALNAAIRALAEADMLSERQVTEWAAAINEKPSLEEEKLLWRLRQQDTLDRP